VKRCCMYEPTHQPPSLQSNAPAGHRMSVDLLLSPFSCPPSSQILKPCLAFAKQRRGVVPCYDDPVLESNTAQQCREKVERRGVLISRSERDAVRMGNEGGGDVAALRWGCCLCVCVCVCVCLYIYDGDGGGVLRVRKPRR
jgi:hypothetical protein